MSEDGLTFKRDATNPIFRPTGDWSNGRAIDAEVLIDGDRALLYYAPRDALGQTQLIGVAAAPARSSFARSEWRQLGTGPVLAPTLPWEKKCVEGPSVVKRDGRYHMFYAGAFNNEPQQVGLAVSADGVTWTRASQERFLRNGAPGEWNASESGHPHLFADPNGGTYLFFQGNRTGGKNWYLSQLPIRWTEGGPSL